VASLGVNKILGGDSGYNIIVRQKACEMLERNG
jgi:hypothetical protein